MESIATQIERTKRELGLALIAGKISELTNDARIRTLRTKLERLRLKRDAQFKADMETLRRFEAQHQITRVHESLFKPLGMDEYPGEGEHHHDIMEE